MNSEIGKKQKNPHARINNDVSDVLFTKIIEIIALEKAYRKPNYTAAQLAKELNTNPRYISVAIATHTDGNFNQLINSYRLREAYHMLRSSKYRSLSAEKIGMMCGFASRQAFYLAFHREQHMTPRQFRLKEMEG